MIKVNLGARKRSVNVAPASSGGSVDLKDIISRLRSGGGLGENPATKALIKQLVIYGIILGGANYLIDDYKAQELQKVAAQAEEVRSKLKLINSELSKTSGFEKLKQDLESDERMIRTKIETIQKLVDDRTTPPKILISLSQAMPKDVWLQAFDLRGAAASFRGQATGLDVVTDFIRSLEESAYFKNVQLKNSSSVRDKGVDLASFELEATRR